MRFQLVHRNSQSVVSISTPTLNTFKLAQRIYLFNSTVVFISSYYINPSWISLGYPLEQRQRKRYKKRNMTDQVLSPNS